MPCGCTTPFSLSLSPQCRPRGRQFASRRSVGQNTNSEPTAWWTSAASTSLPDCLGVGQLCANHRTHTRSGLQHHHTITALVSPCKTPSLPPSSSPAVCYRPTTSFSPVSSWTVHAGGSATGRRISTDEHARTHVASERGPLGPAGTPRRSGGALTPPHLHVGTTSERTRPRQRQWRTSVSRRWVRGSMVTGNAAGCARSARGRTHAEEGSPRPRHPRTGPGARGQGCRASSTHADAPSTSIPPLRHLMHHRHVRGVPRAQVTVPAKFIVLTAHFVMMLTIAFDVSNVASSSCGIPQNATSQAEVDGLQDCTNKSVGWGCREVEGCRRAGDGPCCSRAAAVGVGTMCRTQDLAEALDRQCSCPGLRWARRHGWHIRGRRGGATCHHL